MAPGFPAHQPAGTSTERRERRKYPIPPQLPPTRIPSVLLPAAASLASSSQVLPTAHSRPVPKTHSQGLRLVAKGPGLKINGGVFRPLPWGILTSREALASACSVGHFYIAKETEVCSLAQNGSAECDERMADPQAGDKTCNGRGFRHPQKFRALGVGGGDKGQSPASTCCKSQSP